MSKTRARGPKKKAAKKKPSKRKSKAASPELPASIHVKLTHPERILFPDAGLTKLALATYYAQVARWMLPHVVDRPLSIVRCPDGQEGQCFFQKHAGAGTPAALGRVDIQEKSGVGEYLYVRNVDGLAALAQISALEIHVWGSLRDKVDRPDRLIFDLDPDEGLPWPRVIAGAVRIRDILIDRGLESFVKTTGGKGLHVVAPLSPRRYDWDRVKAFAKELADQLSASEPNAYTSNMSKAQRKGKIFVDYLRNDFGSTAIAPYSTRRKPNATVAMPVEWKELPNIRPDQFTVANALAHIQSRKRDPWAEMFDVQQTL
jgi:bifunctional non-homologous end joining protein LigD